MRVIRKFNETQRPIRVREAIGKKDIERFERDATNLSKNLRRIKTIKDFILVKKSHMQWANDFDEFVFKNIMNDRDRTNNSSEDKARIAVQEYILFIQNYLFRPMESGEAWYYAKQYGIHNFSSTELELYPPEGQEIMFAAWLKLVDSLYQKYNKLRRTAFDELYAYFDSAFSTGIAPELYKSLVDKIQGVNISWRYNETQDEKVLKTRIDLSKIALEKSLSILNKSKFSFLLHNATINVELEPSFVYGGRWEGLYKNTVLLSAPVNLKGVDFAARALIHEFGHKCWDLLSDSQRSLFFNVFFDSKFKVETRHMLGLFEAFKKALGKLKNLGSSAVREIFHQGLLYEFIQDDEFKFIYELIIYNEILEHTDMFFSQEELKEIMEKKNYQILYDQFKSIVGFELATVAVTGYARQKGSLEAFPELFSYILMRYDVPDLARELFMATTGVYNL